MGHRAGWRLRAGGTALLILFGGPLRAEKKPPVPTFAAGVDIVSLNLVVTDVSGRQLPSLGADDIALFEDGVPQQISLFAQEEWPLRLSILLDSSGSMGAALPVAKRAATRLVRTLRPGDEAQVAQFSRRLDLLQESTDDQDALERAINRIVPQAETALYDALYITLKDLTREGGGDDLFRRAIIVLSDGEDTASMVIDEQLLDLARRAGVVVYSVGLLTPRCPDALPSRSRPTS